MLPLNDKISGFTSFKFTPKSYRLVVGYLEMVCGSLLVALPNDWHLKNLSTFILILDNLLSLYTHFKLNDKFERLAPSIVFSLMLICRLIVYYQIKRREENQDKAKEREERRKLIETGEFDLDQISLSDDEETIEDIDDDELEKLIRISRKLNKQKKSKLTETKEHSELDEGQELSAQEFTNESKLLLDELNGDQILINDETKKSI